MTTLLTTARLRLRAVTETDVAHLVELDSDPAVMRYLTGGRPPREEVVARALPRMVRRHLVTGLPGYWAAEERGSGAFLGWFELRPRAADDADEMELGYRLRRAAWGVGHATEGAVPWSTTPSRSWAWRG